MYNSNVVCERKFFASNLRDWRQKKWKEEKGAWDENIVIDLHSESKELIMSREIMRIEVWSSFDAWIRREKIFLQFRVVSYFSQLDFFFFWIGLRIFCVNS